MRPGRLLFVAACLLIAYQLEGWLQPRSKPTLRAGATFEERLLSQTSYQVRRVIADLLWNRIDGYIHESAQLVDPETGMMTSSYVGNYDVLALIDWVITLDPYFVDAQSTLASFYEGIGEDEKAIAVLEKAIADNQKDPYVVDFLGQLANIRIRRHDPLRPISNLLDALARIEEGRGQSPTYSEENLRGTLIAALYREGRLLEARWNAMRGPHDLPPGHEALNAIGPVPAPPPREPQAASPGDEHHEGDGHDHGAKEPAAPGPEPAARPHDPHRRPWFEAHRLEDIRRRTCGAALLLLLTVPLLRRGRRQ